MSGCEKPGRTESNFVCGLVDLSGDATQIALDSDYAAGDLPSPDHDEFETYLIELPQLVAEVELEIKMRRGIIAAKRRGRLPSSLSAKDSQ